MKFSHVVEFENTQRSGAARLEKLRSCSTPKKIPTKTYEFYLFFSTLLFNVYVLLKKKKKKDEGEKQIIFHTVAAEAFSDFAATMQLQCYNHGYVIMGTIPLLAE